jgi:hypothetical protein
LIVPSAPPIAVHDQLPWHGQSAVEPHRFVQYDWAGLDVFVLHTPSLPHWPFAVHAIEMSAETTPVPHPTRLLVPVLLALASRPVATPDPVVVVPRPAQDVVQLSRHVAERQRRQADGRAAFSQLDVQSVTEEPNWDAIGQWLPSW